MHVLKNFSACKSHLKCLLYSQVSSILRLSSRCFVSQHVWTDDTEEITEVLETKVIYNSQIRYFYKQKRRYIEPREKTLCESSHVPVALKMLGLTSDVNVTCSESSNVKPQSDSTKIANLPFTYYLSPEMNIERVAERSSEEPGIEQSFYTSSEIRKSRKWMTDYEYYTVEDDANQSEACPYDEWSINYGTPNASIPVSDVPCGGCGARMQCQEPSIPGYLPSEIFLECNEDDLKGLLCQRCHFLKNYNTALSVQVDPNSYEDLLKQMKENSLVILMVDLTDFPCSIWPGIVDVIGRKRPIFVVGNKVDLLWGDRKNWLKHVEDLLKKQFPSYANILDVSLISAKTGYGVENLITKLHTIWKYKGNVYVIGCTNVGKSTLFNALLSSDYCKSKAVDLIQRATTAPWPKTTLNLLKFPILRPEGWKLHLRDKRLSMDKQRVRAEEALRKDQFSKKKKKTDPITLIGHIAHTFKRNLNKEEDTFALSKSTVDPVSKSISVMDSDFPEYKNSHWFYDTPGVLHKDQILDLLTTEELILTVPKSIIHPNSYRILSGWSIFIGGLARLDFIQGPSPIRICTFSSGHLPVTVCTMADADDVYNSLLRSKYLGVPLGPEFRLKQWPGLTKGEEFSVCGTDENESCADIVLSSAGWISLSPAAKEICKFVPWTPYARGIHVRHPSLLPFVVKLRGKKMRHTPTYGKIRPYFESQ